MTTDSIVRVNARTTTKQQFAQLARWLFVFALALNVLNYKLVGTGRCRLPWLRGG